MCGTIATLFIVVPLVELFLLVEIGKRIGASQTLSLVILAAFLGAFLARLEGWRTLQNIQSDLARGIMPGRRMVDGMLILTGAILLIIPGVLTDIIGLLMLFPLTRILFRNVLIRILKKKMDAEFDILHSNSGFTTNSEFSYGSRNKSAKLEIGDYTSCPRKNKGEIIDAEFVDKKNEDHTKNKDE